MESPEAFQAFLLWLGQDDAAGARKYEEIRKKLILLFSCRGCPNPEELADLTIDRTAMVVLKPDFTYIGDPVAYFRGVARNVYFEWERKQRKFTTAPIEDADPQPQASGMPDWETETLSLWLETCLGELPAEKRSLLLDYYQSEKRAKIDGRQLLAEREGVGLNALRIQIFRLRNAVRQCIERHLRRTETQWPETTSHK
jgi:DNA-directed RNA polymerase specialized sigma24 family protein